MSSKEHTKSSIANEYLISATTLNKWLRLIIDKLPRLKKNPNVKKLTPKEYAIIKEHFGE